MRGHIAFAVVTGALISAPAFAHHSFAPHFDSSKPVSISGTLTMYEARNPHSYVHIQAVDENGKTQEYVCESHGVTQLTRNGITPQILKVGSRIRVTGSLSRHSPYMCFFNDVYFPGYIALAKRGNGYFHRLFLAGGNLKTERLEQRSDLILADLNVQQLFDPRQPDRYPDRLNFIAAAEGYLTKKSAAALQH